MKAEGLAKQFLLAFLVVLAGYFIIYQAIEHRRTRQGPWRVTFTANAASAPLILIDHTRLAITNVQIVFADQARPAESAPVTLLFGEPKPVPYAVPLGQCVFMDTTFLPGTVTLQLFGHEIELLPRVITIDHQEHPWRSDTTITLQRSQTAPVPVKP
jgi:hypothetical protein